MTANERAKHNLFTEIIAESREQLLATVRWLVPTIEDAEDIMQDVMSRLWFNFDEIRSPEKTSAWLYLTAVRLILSMKAT